MSNVVPFPVVPRLAFFTPDGECLGPSVPCGVEARVAFAVYRNKRWHEVPKNDLQDPAMWEHYA